jgi:hypothetical protein
MFDYDSPKPKEPVDYTGFKIGALAAPAFFIVTFLYNADAGLAACIVFGVLLFSIKNPLAFEETYLVLDDHCCHLSAAHSFSFYAPLAPRTWAYAFLYDATRNRGFSNHLRSFEARGKTSVERSVFQTGSGLF